MSALFGVSLVLSIGSAFLAIVLGRNLTRSVVAGFASLLGLALALLIARAEFLGLLVVTLGALALATIQLFGWMLVDVDRDHLPRTDAPTWFARGLAFLLFAGALGLLAAYAGLQGELGGTGMGQSGDGLAARTVALAEPRVIGALLFGEMREVTTFLGFSIAGGLLSSILLLRDDGRDG